jgi:hypothetical protein
MVSAVFMRAFRLAAPVPPDATARGEEAAQKSPVQAPDPQDEGVHLTVESTHTKHCPSVGAVELIGFPIKLEALPLFGWACANGIGNNIKKVTRIGRNFLIPLTSSNMIRLEKHYL